MDSTIKVGDPIAFVNNTIYLASDSTAAVNKYLDTQVSGGVSANAISATVVGPTDFVSLCQETTVEILNIQNDGGKGVQSLTWSLVTITPSSSDATKVNTIISTANLLQSTVLRFPRTTLTASTNYTFQVVATS